MPAKAKITQQELQSLQAFAQKMEACKRQDFLDRSVSATELSSFIKKAQQLRKYVGDYKDKDKITLGSRVIDTMKHALANWFDMEDTPVTLPGTEAPPSVRRAVVDLTSLFKWANCIEAHGADRFFNSNITDLQQLRLRDHAPIRMTGEYYRKVAQRMQDDKTYPEAGLPVSLDPENQVSDIESDGAHTHARKRRISSDTSLSEDEDDSDSLTSPNSVRTLPIPMQIQKAVVKVDKAKKIKTKPVVSVIVPSIFHKQLPALPVTDSLADLILLIYGRHAKYQNVTLKQLIDKLEYEFDATKKTELSTQKQRNSQRTKISKYKRIIALLNKFGYQSFVNAFSGNDKNGTISFVTIAIVEKLIGQRNLALQESVYQYYLQQYSSSVELLKAYPAKKSGQVRSLDGLKTKLVDVYTNSGKDLSDFECYQLRQYAGGVVKSVSLVQDVTNLIEDLI